MPRQKKVGIENIKNVLLPVLLASFLFALFAFSSVLFRRSVSRAGEERLNSRFEVETGVLLKVTEDKFEKYALLLHSARALFNSSDDVNRFEWNAFSDSLDLDKNYPSLTALAYIKKVDLDNIDEFINGVRSDKSIDNNGYLDFDITPNVNSEELYVVDYIEPISGNETALGYNIFSDPARRKALELARDADMAVVTGPITLVQETSDEKSFLILLPVYENVSSGDLADRRKSVQGFVAAALRAPDLISDIVVSRPLTYLTGLSVTDVTEEPTALLPYIDVFGSVTNISHIDAPIVQSSRINFGARTWQIDFKSDIKPEVEGFNLIAPYVLLGLGFVISLLFALVLINSIKIRERAEGLARELTRDLTKFKLAVDNSSDHIVITDVDGTIIYANESVERITGFKLNEVVGKKAGSKDLWGGEMDKETYKKFWHRIKVEKKSFSGEFFNHKKSGEKYIAEANVSPVLDQNGEVIFFVGIERDVTRVKELDKMKDEFVSVASHELRTPMTAIKGFTSMILEGDYGKPPSKMIEPLTNIITSSERLINLVNDLLNLSRITAGRLKFNLENFKVLDVINSTLKMLVPIAEKKGLKLTLEGSTDYEVFSDKDKLSQVLNNLIGNSIKFTDNGEIKLTLKEEDGLLKVFISDTGIGISEKDIDRVFQKFEQVTTAQTGKPQGTGLGLYISKQIANKLGGDIWVESSEVGKGSVFGFSMLLTKNPNVKKIINLITKESETHPDQKEMS